MKIVPEYLLRAAENLFKSNNIALASTVDFDAIDTPKINECEAKRTAVCTNNDNKPDSTKLDLNYIPHI